MTDMKMMDQTAGHEMQKAIILKIVSYPFLYPENVQ